VSVRDFLRRDRCVRVAVQERLRAGLANAMFRAV
jgi:hypothetical protein